MARQYEKPGFGCLAAIGESLRRLWVECCRKARGAPNSTSHKTAEGIRKPRLAGLLGGSTSVNSGLPEGGNSGETGNILEKAKTRTSHQYGAGLRKIDALGLVTL